VIIDTHDKETWPKKKKLRCWIEEGDDLTLCDVFVSADYLYVQASIVTKKRTLLDPGSLTAYPCTEDGWIRVEDGMPPEDTDVLVSLIVRGKCEGIATARINKKTREWEIKAFNGYGLKWWPWGSVTNYVFIHSWMPAPKLP